MAQWGNSDAASNASIQWVSQVKKTQNTSNRTDLYGNTSASYFGNKGAAGFFAVDTTEARISAGPLAVARVLTPGSGYAANAAVTVTATNGGGTTGAANATANATGRISALNISTAGSGYKTNPTVVIAAPAAITINANTTGVIAATDFILISTANSKFLAGDRVFYGVTTGNTATAGLTGNTFYYVSFANTTGIVLSTTNGGANIDLTEARAVASEAGHSIQGETATGFIAVGGGQNKGVTAGWNLRTAGTGGRAGRVQNECLVAMRSISTDGADDTILPDA
jgi:hypothetical protein